jgi:hypothetical protein
MSAKNIAVRNIGIIKKFFLQIKKKMTVWVEHLRYDQERTGKKSTNNCPGTQMPKIT